MLLLLLNGILVHRWVTPSNRSPVPIYTPGWRETKWSRINCLRKQGDGRSFNPGPPEFVVLSARPHTPPFWGEGLTGVPTVKPVWQGRESNNKHNSHMVWLLGIEPGLATWVMGADMRNHHCTILARHHYHSVVGHEVRVGIHIIFYYNYFVSQHRST